MKKRKINAKSPPFNFLYFLDFFLIISILVLLFFLIKERIYLEQNKILLSKYRIYLSKIFLKKSEIYQKNKPEANPSSSTNFIYITPQNFSYLETYKR